MSNNSQTQRGGIGFLGLLTILFIGLKLTNYITWSWWLVLLPIWGPIAFVAVLFILFFVGGLIFQSRPTRKFR